MKLTKKNINNIVIGLVVLLMFMTIYFTMSEKNNEYEYTNYSRVIALDEKNSDINIKDNKFVLTYELPPKKVADESIVFHSNHEIINVFVDGKLIYYTTPNLNSKSKTTGSVYHTIDIREEYIGKTIEIEKTSVYNKEFKNFDCYYGDETDIYRHLISKDIKMLMTSFMILFLGIGLIVYYHAIISRSYRGSRIKYLAYFSVALGLWKISEVKLVSLFITNGTMINLVCHMSLMMVPLLFTLYLYKVYKYKNIKVWHYIYVYNVVIILSRILLQLSGIMDFYESLWITHIGMIITGMLIISSSIAEIVKSKNIKTNKEIKMHAISIILLVVFVVTDIVVYKVFTHSSSIGAIAYLVYIIIIGIDTVTKASKELQYAKELEIYKRLAYVDELTNLYNRMAYEKNIQNYNEKILIDKNFKPAVIMFDLNDLKLCNDKYGHTHGDRYLKMMANMCIEVFERERYYRIGGDEFCVVMLNANEEIVKDKMNRLHKLIEEKNQEGFVVNISVAYGYAVYDESIDRTIEDTRHRADKLMYINKKNIKNRAKVVNI